MQMILCPKTPGVKVGTLSCEPRGIVPFWHPILPKRFYPIGVMLDSRSRRVRHSTSQEVIHRNSTATPKGVSLVQSPEHLYMLSTPHLPFRYVIRFILVPCHPRSFVRDLDLIRATPALIRPGCYTSSYCSLDSEILSASFEAGGNKMCYADSVTIPEEPSIISGPRQKVTVDYKKLYNEMFGKDAPAYGEISDDEDWGPSRKKRRQKETDGADILLTLHENNGNFLNREISLVDKDSPHRSSKRSSVKFSQKMKLPSRSVCEDLSKDLGIRFEKVNKWFNNARYTALKSRKIYKEHEEPTATKTVPQKESAEDSSLQPKGSKKKGAEKSFARAVRKLPKRRFSDTHSPQENEAWYLDPCLLYPSALIAEDGSVFCDRPM